VQSADTKDGTGVVSFLDLTNDIGNRKLAVNEAEAETVCLISQRYLDLGCVRPLCDDLRRRGVTSKRHISTSGRVLRKSCRVGNMR